MISAMRPLAIHGERFRQSDPPIHDPHRLACRAARADARVVRLAIDLSAEGYARFTTMKEQTGAASYSQVIRDAMRIYETIVEETSKGKTVLIVDENNPSDIKKLFLAR